MKLMTKTKKRRKKRAVQARRRRRRRKNLGSMQLSPMRKRRPKLTRWCRPPITTKNRTERPHRCRRLPQLKIQLRSRLAATIRSSGSALKRSLPSCTKLRSCAASSRRSSPRRRKLIENLCFKEAAVVSINVLKMNSSLQ
uniref:(northern house mosquito) hypothetical protein n=1 Tax=Culex pipiens TaxID=7175 RepID=A0A8D8HG14_CULPI